MDSASGLDDVVAAAMAEYLTRLDNGEDPEIEDYVRRYPQHEQAIRDFLDDWEFVDVAAQQSRATSISEDRRSCTRAGERGLDVDEINVADISIPGHDIHEMVGSGSQGLVFRATQRETQRTVALKLLRPGTLTSRQAVARFKREIQLAAQLRHPGVVTVYEAGTSGRYFYYSMEYVDGLPINIYAAQGHLDEHLVVSLLINVAEAVHYAHQFGVIHRDLKPTNILVDGNGFPRILDFGLALMADQSDTKWREHGFAGTWSYASPEQTEGDPSLVSVRSDVYTLAVILYELLCSELPYPVDGCRRPTVVRRIREMEPVPLSRVCSLDAPDLEYVALKALRKAPDDRYPSAGAFADDLRRCLVGQAVEARASDRGYVLRTTLWRHKFILSAATLAVGLLLAFSITVTVLYREADEAQRTTQARMNFVRDRQAFELRELSAAHQARNIVYELKAVDPDLPPIKRRLQPEWEGGWDVVVPLYESLPDKEPHRIDEIDAEAFRAWLIEHADEIAYIADEVLDKRLMTEMKASEEENFAIADVGVHFREALALGGVLLGDGVRLYADGADDRAIDRMRALRALTIDISDGAHSASAALAIELRIAYYRAVCAILTDAASKGVLQSGWDELIIAEPAVPPLKPKLLYPWMLLLQEVENSIVIGDGGQPLVSMLLFDRDLYYSQTGLMAEAGLTHDDFLASQSTKDTINRHFEAIAGWDDLPVVRIREQARSMRDSTDPVLIKLLQAELPTQQIGMYVRRSEARSARVAMILASYAVRYRLQHGRWPESTGTAVPAEHMQYVSDPYTAEPFLWMSNADGIEISSPWGLQRRVDQPILDARGNVMLYPSAHPFLRSPITQVRHKDSPPARQSSR